MNQTTRQAIAIVTVLLLLVGIGAASGNYASKLPNATNTTSSQAVPTNVQPITYKGEENKTVLELLKQNHSVTTQDSSFGTFVTAINGISSAETTAWLYYIDGKLGQEAADKTTTNPNQTIEWRYESF